MARAFLVVMDSVGIGGAPDADRFFSGGVPDVGANTVGHIAEWCARERPEGALRVPVLDGLGLGAAVRLASGLEAPGLGATPTGLWGAATEKGPGKDTPSGHWELAGQAVPFEWTYFPETVPCFPDDIIAAVCRAAGVDGVLGNCRASGTEIIDRLGAEHMRSGRPICYTSADSVFQIAAHEEVFGLERLLRLCEAIAPMLHARRVGRVIARPFLGDAETGFTRTSNRKDYAMTPPAPVLPDWIAAAGGVVHGIGKIGDIFSMRGIASSAKGRDAELMRALQERVERAEDFSLTFANFVEFDSEFGHRRDPGGYAAALEWFDREIGKVIDGLREGDLMILTADHGNDPTWAGTEHTRERVPVLCAGARAGSIGHVDFADVAASIAAHLGIEERGEGRSFL